MYKESGFRICTYKCRDFGSSTRFTEYATYLEVELYDDYLYFAGLFRVYLYIRLYP